MDLIINIFIFCLVLFVYLHIHFHLKTSDDLEIFEIERTSKEYFEEICDLRQPTIFKFNTTDIVNQTNRKSILEKYYAFDIKVRKETNTTDEHKENKELYLSLPLHVADKIFNDNDSEKTKNTDNTSNSQINNVLFSENNSDFLNETGLSKLFKNNDRFFRPSMVSNCHYDVIFGSSNSHTPFRYELNYRNFFMPTLGNIKVILTPPKNTKYLFPNYDYDNFEFSSPINPWNPQPHFDSQFSKVKCLEFTVEIGSTLYIPPYWWYSFKFDDVSSLSVLKYRTYMNNLSIAPYISLYTLQRQNINRHSLKTLQNVKDSDS